MSGQLHRPGAPGGPGGPGTPGARDHGTPLVSPAQAAALLEHVIYEQVLECVDLDALYQLEQSLTLSAGDLEGIDHDHAADLAKSMLDRALLRLPDDMRRYLRAVEWMSCDGCELCEAEASLRDRGPQRRSATRPKS
jgi:hypothetical protein